MPIEWKALQSVAHSCTRITHINADLIRQLVPNATAKTILKGRWTFDADKKALVLEIKEITEEVTANV
jgi:hypothetical protein